MCFRHDDKWLAAQVGTFNEYFSRRYLPETPLERTDSEKEHLSAEKRCDEYAAKVLQLEKQLDIAEEEKQGMKRRVCAD